MTDRRFNISITGNILNDSRLEDVHKAFASLFKISTEEAVAAFNQAPIIIKKAVDELSAKKYKAALNNANIEVSISVYEQVSTSTTEPTTATEVSSSNTKQHEGYEAKRNTAIVSTRSGYRFQLEGQPDFTFLTVQIPHGETIKVEASSMATMDTHLMMKTRMKGGIGRVLTGESLFINDFTAEDAPADIGIAPGAPGDIIHKDLNNSTLYLKNSAYLASSSGVKVETKLDLFKGIFSGSGLILIQCSGDGDLWFNTYGAAIEIDVDGEYIVDTDKIVAWSDELDYKIKSVGGYKSLFFSGEGFVCHFSGKGKLWVQTRGDKAFASWAQWFRPAKG